ncbi:protein HsdA [[Pasteurella] mairii]|uniref:Protein HsdA n=1 Tax=[Pasteurella] mairii TaxID=757 RepID=A0A379B5F8_9PAST|nr:protein HsdA [[Pasteurella] mairii]
MKKDIFVKESQYVVYEQQNVIYDNYETRYFISQNTFKMLKAFEVKTGDFLMSGAGTIGKISRVPSNIKQGVFNQAIIRFQIDEESTDAEYFLQLMRSDSMQNRLTSKNPGSAITNFVPMAELKEWHILLPSIEEQTAIGNFFKQLDDTIALHRRNYIKIQNVKAAYLEYIFSSKFIQNKSKNTNAWEQRKLGDLAEIRRGASPRPIHDEKWFDKNSEIGWLRISDVTEQNGRIKSIEQRLSKEGQEKTLVLNKPNLILSIAATVGKPVINYIPTGIHDGFIVFLNLNADMEFLFQWLEIFRPQWQKSGQSGSQVNINSELVREQKITLPKSKEEQTAIGNFFKQLDDTIALHQRKHQKMSCVRRENERLF